MPISSLPVPRVTRITRAAWVAGLALVAVAVLVVTVINAKHDAAAKPKKPPSAEPAPAQTSAGSTEDSGSLGAIARIVGADTVWASGVTGRGVDVAVIDTGVVPVRGLASGNVVNGPDLSFDSQRADLRYKDAYGHGTHVASIIAGRDVAGPPSSYTTNNEKFTGVAPDTRVVNVKVGAADGAVDVSQVIAAINWVSENGRKHGLNIRVINLSYGADSGAAYQSDALSFAAEVAWRKGIVVVVAAGNDGSVNKDLALPALNPNLLAVGAVDPNGTVSTSDDTLADFSDRGRNNRYADVVAPGTHVLGLRVPNGVVDQAHPASQVGTRYTRGSGTSQATAVVSGAAALLLSRYPDLTPDQVKGALMATASLPPAGTPKKMGTGVINVADAAAAIADRGPAALAVTGGKYGKGTGHLDKSRGSAEVIDTDTAGRDVVLTGQRDIFGRSWDGKAWAKAALDGRTWAGGRWNGSTWTGTSFDTSVDTTGNWKTVTWTGNSWSGRTWTGRTWVGRTWVNGSWDGRTWVEETWAGRTWVDRLWSSATWN